MSGKILKKRREELGQDLKSIANVLKIRHDYLKAIEDEEFERLPVAVYAKGYIREYAKFLKINPDAIIKAYTDKTAPPVIPSATPPAIEKSLPVIRFPKKKMPWFKYAVGVIVIVFAYMLFSRSSIPEKKEAPLQNSQAKIQQHLPETKIARPVEKIQPVIQPVSPVQQTQQVQQTQTVQPPQQVSQPQQVQPAQPIQPVQQIQQTPVPQKEEKDKAKTETAKEHVLEISAIDTTWLIATIDGTESKDMLLRQGDALKLSAKQGFSLKIGNAGGIKLVFDGKNLGALGENNQVVNITLPDDKNKLQ